LRNEKQTLKDKIIPYAIYVLTICAGIFNELSGSRDIEAVAWRKFAARNKHVIVTNVISDAKAAQSKAIAVEITGMGSGDKRAIMTGTQKHVSLTFLPKVGDELILSVKNGLVIAAPKVKE